METLNRRQKPAFLPIRTSSWHEFKQLIVLAWPITIAQIAQVSNSVVDVVLTGNYDKLDQAAVAIGSSLYWPILMLFSGTLFSVTPTISQLRGEGRLSETGAVARQAVWQAIAGAAIVICILFNSETVYHFFEVDPAPVPIAVEYLRVQCFGIVAIFCYNALRGMCDGLALTRIGMAIALIGLCLKIPLTYLFIYGGFGLDARGGVGCGYATAIVLWVQLACLLVIIRFSRARSSGLFNRFDWPDFRVIWNLVRIGFPIGFAIFIEVVFFSFVTIFIGRLGVDAVASHQSAMSIASVSFMIPLSIGLATTILVSNHIGARYYVAAGIAVKVAISISLWCGGIAAVVLYYFRVPLAGLYTTDPSVLALTSTLLVFAAFFQLFDASQITMQSCLRGYKDTTAAAVITFFSFWLVGLPIGLVFGLDMEFPFVGSVLALTDFEPLGVRGFWVGLISGLLIVSTLLGIRVLRFVRRFSQDPEFRSQRLKSI